MEFDDYVATHFARLFRLGVALTNDRGLAGDVVQEVLISGGWTRLAGSVA